MLLSHQLVVTRCGFLVATFLPSFFSVGHFGNSPPSGNGLDREQLGVQGLPRHCQGWREAGWVWKVPCAPWQRVPGMPWPGLTLLRHRSCCPV